MDPVTKEIVVEKAVSDTPEDVAILYSWANLHGAKYRDFSATRREYRAQLRHRAAERAQEAELKAQVDAEAAAEAAERLAEEAEAAARNPLFREGESHEEALRIAEEAGRRAAAERLEAKRRADAATAAEVAARKAAIEMEKAHASVQRQAAQYRTSDSRRRALAGIPGRISDPYTPPMAGSEVVDDSGHGMGVDPAQKARTDLPAERSGERAVWEPLGGRTGESSQTRPQGYRPDDPSGYRTIYRPGASAFEAMAEGRGDAEAGGPYQAEVIEGGAGGQSSQENPPGPAWLYASPVSPPPARSNISMQPEPATVADTLQHSRERVAARWYALKGVFDQTDGGPAEAQPQRQKDLRVPMLAVFSLAGGVGKTSLVATLGRALSSLGERVVLTDTTSYGLLPFYFGASELRPGIVRTFSPPSGSMDAPISLVSYELEQANSDTVNQTKLIDDFTRNGSGSHRMVLDISASSGWVVRRLARMNPTVLIPVAPDMNSVISLPYVEKFFSTVTDADGKVIQPIYLMNQFDASLPLYLDVREVLRRQLGERLLPFVVRRSPAVSEALAEGMTVVDYAPDAPISEDFLNVAKWLRKTSMAASTGYRNVRWSER